MSNALQTVHTVKPATTDLCLRLGFVVFVRGPLRAHLGAVEDLLTRLQAGLLRKRFTRYRLGSQMSWTPLPESTQSGFADLCGMRDPLVNRWGLELAEAGDERGDGPSSVWLQVSDLAPVLGMERASHVRVLFPDDAPVAPIAALGEWAIRRLPLWWGAAGFVFHHTSGTTFTAHTRMAALAKRYWAVQIQDIATLQWDSLLGMPSVNWLTLIGDEFARSKAMSIEALAAEAASMKSEGVSYRQGTFGVAIAAGPTPVRGDINTSEDIGAFVRMAKRLQPLLLTQHTPLFGPFARPDVLNAWLARFAAPHAWLECDIAPK